MKVSLSVVKGSGVIFVDVVKEGENLFYIIVELSVFFLVWCWW